MKDIRIVARVYNNQLRERREALGMKSGEFARSIGIEPGVYCAYEGLKRSPLTSGRERGARFARTEVLRPRTWRSDALAIAGALGVEPEALFPDAVLEIKKTVAETRVDADDLVAMLPPAHSSPFGLLASGEESALVADVVATLSPREQDVIVSRFVNEETLDEVGERHGVTRERMRQIEKGALRKLRQHPALKELGE